MTVTINGTTGVTTPGVTNSGNETIAGTLQVGGVTTNVYPLVSGTSVASTSGTSIDFTSIPSWVKRITVMFSGVSTNGTNVKQIQIGSGSFTTSGYGGAATRSGSSSLSTSNFSGGFTVNSINASDVLSGSFVICNLSGNTWQATGVFADDSTTSTFTSAGKVTLSGALDRLRVISNGLTDTFDAGSINILYE